MELAAVDLAARDADASATVLRRAELGQERGMLSIAYVPGATSIAFEKLGWAIAQW